MSQDGLGEQRNLQEAECGDGQQHPVAANPVERDQQKPHKGEHLQDITAVNERMKRADKQQQNEAPDKAPGKIDPARSLVRHDSRKPKAEKQGKNRESFPREKRVNCHAPWF